MQLALLLLLALAMLVPLLWLVSTSLKGPTENIFSSPPALLPAQPSLQAYGQLFSGSPMGTYLLNSTIVSGLAVAANLLFCSLAAYPLARLRFTGRGLMLALVVATILIPFQVVMIPLYLLMVQLGLRNTLL
ncbi:MAG: carbohydrate ABC transporter permease, partial [Cyanobacteria bacterium K_Offshore_0m_m2_072]|nr:carbohydrate ABC transporter permease [Cyanobacteria bacterium K_Offshore_0m_m2_072]